MANKVVNGPLGAKLDGSNTSADGAQFLPGTTTIIVGSASAGPGNVAVYIRCGEILSTSAAVAIGATGIGSASAGGYIALGSGNTGDFIWARSSAAIA